MATPRKTAAVKPVSVEAEETVTNGPTVVAFKSKTEKAQVARKVLFTIDDEEYSIPEKVDAVLLYRYEDANRKHGGLAAMLTLLEETLGKDATETLLAWEDLTDEILTQITEMITGELTGENTAAGN